jgi:Lipase (class 3)
MKAMKKTCPSIHSRSALAAIIALTFTFSGCGLLVTSKAALEKDDPKARDTQRVIVSKVEEKPAEVYANKFALMALFAKTVYRKDLPEKDRKTRSCEHLNPGTAPDETGMPSAEGHGRWSRWVGTPDIRACFNASGLAYETYIHTPDDGKTADEAVISFRGTENYDFEEIWHDWGTNFSALFGFAPPQYVIAQQHVPAVIAKLHALHPGIKVYVTGHSLGGELAQQAAYMSDENDDKNKVEAAFTFDPSPVTNWSQLEINKAVKTPDPVIYRAYHAKEGLAYVRNVTTRFNSRRLNRSDYDFYFQKLKPTAAHEMGVIACHLANRIQGDVAEHHYPKTFAKKVIDPTYRGKDQKPSDEHPICPAGVELD